MASPTLRDLDGAVMAADADADENVVKDISSGAATLLEVRVDNSANSAITYIKLFDNVAPVLGTTAPDMILPTEASTGPNGGENVFSINPSTGVSFSNGISYAAVTAGGTGGTTGPTSACKVELVFKRG